MTPEDLKYTEEHEWIATTGPNTVRIGVTAYAQEQLGDVVFVELPETGRTVAAGDAIGEVESTKSVSEIFAPLAGEVTAVNNALDDAPELINSAPYGDGWIIELTLEDSAALGELLDAAAYQKLTEG